MEHMSQANQSYQAPQSAMNMYQGEKALSDTRSAKLPNIANSVGGPYGYNRGKALSHNRKYSNSTHNNIIRTVDGRMFRPMTLLQSEQGDVSQKDYTNETGSFKMLNIN